MANLPPVVIAIAGARTAGVAGGLVAVPIVAVLVVVVVRALSPGGPTLRPAAGRKASRVPGAASLPRPQYKIPRAGNPASEKARSQRSGSGGTGDRER